MAVKKNRLAAATCGLYCGACLIHIAGKAGHTERLEEMAKSLSIFVGKKIEMKNVVCEGCQGEIKAFHCRNCLIRSCAIEKGFTLCSECETFPCERITGFNNDGMAHHSEVLENIRRQKEIGVDAWIKEQDKRWRCPQCGRNMDWYSSQCSGCGKTLPGKILKKLSC